MSLGVMLESVRSINCDAFEMRNHGRGDSSVNLSQNTHQEPQANQLAVIGAQAYKVAIFCPKGFLVFNGRERT